MKGCPFKNLFIIHVKGKYISIQQKMTEIGTCSISFGLVQHSQAKICEY